VEPVPASPVPDDRPAPILARLHVAAAADDVFAGAADDRPGRMFGGQLVAQALAAAIRTAPDGLAAHSLHGHFLHPGARDRPVRYAVERTRNGLSYATRRVVAEQGERVLFLLTASFQRPESGAEYQVDRTPVALDIDALDPGRYANEYVDWRDVRRADDPEAAGHRRAAWFRVRGALPDDPAVHQVALAWASDNGPTRAARQPHAENPAVERRTSVSLDHAVWFHRPARADRWLYSELRPVSTGGGRGLATGTIHDRDGRLVASVSQEVMLRIPAD
jgi:acyl-CoA thioesterase II